MSRSAPAVQANSAFELPGMHGNVTGRLNADRIRQRSDHEGEA